MPDEPAAAPGADATPGAGATSGAGAASGAATASGPGATPAELAPVLNELDGLYARVLVALEREDAAARGEVVPLARQILRAALAVEAVRPGLVDVEQAALLLYQHLVMHADHLAAAADPAAAALRAEADGLEGYLGPLARAGVERDRAGRAATAGRFHEALTRTDAAALAFREAGRHVDAAQTLTALANLYEWLGDHARALALLEDAAGLVAVELADGPPSQAEVDAATARQTAAIERGEASTEGLDAQALRRLHHEILQGRARLSRLVGRLAEAERLWLLARPFVEDVLPGAADFHLARLALERGDLDRAERLLGAAEGAFGGLARPRLGALRLVQADLALARRRPGEALARVQEGLADQATYPDLALAWQLQWRRARALVGLGRDREALDAYAAAASAADATRAAPLGPVLDTLFLRDKLPLLEAAVDHALAVGDAAAVVRFVELGKARALAAVLARPPAPGGGTASVPAPDPALRRDEARFDEVCRRLDAVAFAMDSGTPTAAHAAERDRLLDERAALLERLRVHDPRWRVVTEPVAVDPAALGARLAATGRRALVLHRRGDRVVTALLGDGAPRAAEVTLTPAVAAGVARYVANLTEYEFDPHLHDLSGALGVTLADLMPPELARPAVAADALVVVPHGDLHLLPWAALTLDGQRLFERTAVGVLPNLACLALLDEPGPPAPGGHDGTSPPASSGRLAPEGDDERSAPASSHPALAVALLGDPDYSAVAAVYPPLPQVGPELADIAALYGPAVLAGPVTGADATQEALAALLEDPRAADPAVRAALHVACHADLDATEPLSAGLVLTGASLDAAEILRRRCTFDDVVLSACSTGWRPQTVDGLALTGDDALGLTASFLEAGARSLLVSVPKAHDVATRAVVTAWHRHRLAGLPPLQAHRRALLERYAADPGRIWQWAGMTVYGCR